MRIAFLQNYNNLRAALTLWMLLLPYAGVFKMGTCLPVDNSDSLYYGAATGKGQVVQPVRAPHSLTISQTQPEKSDSVTTARTTVLKVAPLTQAKASQVTLVSEQTAVPAPSKHHDPVCVDPYTLGIPTVQNCADLKIMGRAVGTLVLLQEELEHCELMDDTSCDNGSGEGFRAYQARLSKAGGVALQANPGVGPCLSVEKKPDNSLEVKTALGWASSILCCRPICLPATTTTTIMTVTKTAISSTEAFLPLSDDGPTLPPYQPAPAATPASYVGPFPFVNMSQQIPVLTTPAPSVRASFGEMCVLPRYLKIPYVDNCKDLYNVAQSTNFVQQVEKPAPECSWVDDTTCGPAYPEQGAYLEDGVPNRACLAYKQTTCGNVVGAYPILGKHLRDVCGRSSALSNKGSSSVSMMPVMIMPMPTKGKDGRRLSGNKDEIVNTSFKETNFRRLHGKTSTLTKSGVAASSDSVVICCRLQCSGARSRNSEASVSAITGSGGTGSLNQLMPPSTGGQGAPPQMRGFAGDYGSGDSLLNPSNAALRQNYESEFCQERWFRVCSLATPLIGEQIVFDQRCIKENLSGCNAGGMPCCRSVRLTDF